MNPQRPKPMADVLSELMTRRGFARVQAGELCAAAWQEAAGEFTAGYTRTGAIKRGVLDVIVANSTLVQELTFRKAGLLADLVRLLPDEKIKDLRFRVGPIE